MDYSKEILNVRINSETDCWHHLHGIIKRPKGWVFVEAGTPGLTRSLKSRSHWTVQDRVKLKSGKRGALKQVGLLVPQGSLKQVKGTSKSSASKIAAKERKQTREIEQLEKAVFKFLAFNKKHVKLAKKIAKESAVASAKIGSGGVGRTKTLTLPEKAELCARAHIRHQYTDYESIIESKRKKGAKRMSKTSKKYQEIKQNAHRQVDEFLVEHR